MSAAEVRTTALSGWIERLDSLGVDSTRALQVAGIEPSIIQHPSRFIPLESFTRLTEFVGEHSQNTAVSWSIGEEFDLAKLEEVGSAVTSARTLGGALRRLTDHFELLQDSSSLCLNIDSDSATISYRILDPSIWPRHQDALFSLGIIAKIIKLAIPDAMHFAELGFECPKRETGLNLAHGQLAFDCETNSIRLPIAMLGAAMPSTTASCDMKTLSAKLTQRRKSRSARERLTGIIFARLSDGEINQDYLASEIGMSSRTMRRRLADDATSFQQLLDDCRMQQSVLEFRSRPQASIADIALRLGYAEHSTFTRAFTRWAGIPPQKFRTNLTPTTH